MSNKPHAGDGACGEAQHADAPQALKALSF